MSLRKRSEPFRFCYTPLILCMINKRYDPKRAATAASDLYRHRDHHRHLRRQPIEIRNVLERRNVFSHQDTMALKQLRLAVVYARGVQTDRLDLAVLGQPPGRLRRKPGEVKLGDAFSTT